MPWKIDTTSRKGVLHLELTGALRLEEMDAFVVAHNAAVDAYGDADYRVFCDIRGLLPLPPECAALFEKAKSHSANAPHFRGSAVVVAKVVVALQHERTSVGSGVMSTELITVDEAAAWAHVQTVNRPRPR